MRLRKRVVLGCTALAMVTVAVPEAHSAQRIPVAAVAAYPIALPPVPLPPDAHLPGALPLVALSSSAPSPGPLSPDALSPAGPAFGGSGEATVVSFNACGGVCRHGEVDRTAVHIADVALRPGADAVLLQELCYGQYVRTRKLLAPHGYTGRFVTSTRSRACARTDRRHGTGFGVAMLVRGRISGSAVLPLPTPPGFERRALLGVAATIGGRRTLVVVVHLSPSAAAGLDRQLAVLSGYLNRHAGEPVIVGGDCNALPTRPGLARLYSPAAGGSGDFVEADELRGRRPARGGAATFNAAGRKIDYIFLSNGFFRDPRATSLRTRLSDHHVYVATARITR
jgi:endonuclease/exonuclease/phosphatase family metal-dependent hydrolase